MQPVERVYLLLPPSPRYDAARDLIVTGFLLAASLQDYIIDEDMLVVLAESEGGRRRLLPLPLAKRRAGRTLEPRVEGKRIVYGRGDLTVDKRLALDSRLRYQPPFVADGVLVAIDWRHLLYHTIEELRKTVEAIVEALKDAPRPAEGLEERLVGHAYALLTAARLAGLDKDIRIVYQEGGLQRDTGVIPSSTYRLLSYVDPECLSELESLSLDALQGVDTDSLEYLANAIENRDQYALRHMLRRMGCRVVADELIAPADVLG